ncbi:MAG: hypothetical protein RMJ65_01720 [candidate division WOR-3 bacterium]|nr:hypothetical protein [candidate division WOR-3 bacterium]MDW7987418.1 hypothetical protein [candidate division WOR-3 bacterium]
MCGIKIFLTVILFFNLDEVGDASGAMFVSSVGSKIYSANINPALLSYLNNNNLGIQYLRIYNLVPQTKIVLNYRNFTIGLSSLGVGNYQEVTLKFGVGLRINNEFSYGLGVKNRFLFLTENLKIFRPAIDLGVVFSPQVISSKQLRLIKFAGLLENLNYLVIKDPNNYLAVKFGLGAHLALNENFILSTEFKKASDKTELNFGTEFKLLPSLALRVGCKTNPVLYSAGLGVNYKRFEFDYCLRYHPRLKETNIFSLSFQF